jgi:hypothetical protein
MTVDDLKRLRSYIDVAIEMSEFGGLKAMTEVEKRAFKEKFGDADMVIEDFIIRMCRQHEEGPLLV